MKHFSLSVRLAFSFAACLLTCFCIAFLIMAKREFDDVSVNQILFHMQLMHDNIVTMPADFINVFLWHVKNSFLCAFSLTYLFDAAPLKKPQKILAGIFLLAAWYVVPGKFIDDIFSILRAVFVLALVLSLLGACTRLSAASALMSRILRFAFTGWGLFLIWLGIVAYSLNYVHFFDYFKNQTASGDFYEEGAYVSPASVTVSGTGSKNLLIVYCESIEETFGRSEVMGADLLAPLRGYIGTPDLRIDQMPGADFTIGGIVSSQCGIPLKSVSILSGNLTGWALDKYLPGALCLGDYLKKDGYHNVYYNGSSGLFSGLNKFFLSHGYDEFMGKEDWLRQGADPDSMNIWAFYDSDMIDRSIARIDELMADGRKFSFALSTMDTHEPGFLSPVCRPEAFDNNWFGYVRCSMSQVERLLSHIRDKGWQDDFVILVMGDHLARMPFLDAVDLKHAEGRYVLCSLSRDAKLRPNREIITHFDLFPSILAALGFTVHGDRLGFGYNVFSNDVLPPEGYRGKLKANVMRQSATYEKLWFPDNAVHKEGR